MAFHGLTANVFFSNRWIIFYCPDLFFLQIGPLAFKESECLREVHSKPELESNSFWYLLKPVPEGRTVFHHGFLTHCGAPN